MSDDGRCTYVLPKKKRRCRMLVKSGKRFCGEHAIVDPENEDRVPCPNDPNHTVAASELEVHLQSRCNSRLPNDPWIKVNLNSVQNTDSKEFLRPETEDIVRISKLIEKAYDGLPSVKQIALKSDLIEAHMNENDEFGPSTRKHLIQQSSIIGHLLSHGLLINETGNCVVELGSGKAQLAYWMSKTAPNCRFLLIDKMGTRNKHDNKALQEDGSLQISRLRCSIEHLDLSKVDLLKDSSSLTAVCKHFCGSATDCGIRCLHNAVENGFSLDGFALAPCCHHKCSFSEYVGHSYLSSIGVSDEKSFAALRHISTWALCGFPQTEVHCSDESDDVKLWSKERKEALGRKAKVILEYGRAEYMRTLGFTVELLKYVPSEISPENILMVGKRK